MGCPAGTAFPCAICDDDGDPCECPCHLSPGEPEYVPPAERYGYQDGDDE